MIPFIKKSQRGFSLLELSIVLVVVGLLIGVVQAGRELITTAELHNVVKEFKSFDIAIEQFELKYHALPGVMTNATDFWPTAHNGNGNNENPWKQDGIYFWEHLTLAGLIKGAYTATPDTEIVPGVNAPKSFKNGGYHVIAGIMELGGVRPGDRTCSNLFTITEAQYIDSKIDNGLANEGIIRADIQGYMPGDPRDYTTGFNFYCTDTSGNYLTTDSSIMNCRLAHPLWLPLVTYY